MNLRRIFGWIALLFLLALAAPVFSQTITNVSPPLGATNDIARIDLYGTGFSAGTLTVTFNGVKATQNTGIVNANDIQTQVPAGATTGYIWITNNGNAARSPNQFFVISSNAYVTNFSPTSGGPNTEVILTGVHFSTATNVLFNGILSKKTGDTPNIQENSITVTAPIGVTTGPLVVMSSLGASHDFSTVSNQLSIATNFYVSPTITSFLPSSGRPGTNVAVQGTSFTGITAVMFDGVSAVSFIVTNDTSLGAVVPTNASSGFITVSSPYFSNVQSPAKFLMLPTIYTLSPTSGPSGTLVTVSGAGLNEKSPDPVVTVGGATVTSFITVSANTLSFNVPASAISGPIVITTTNGSVTNSQLFYLPASISSFAPAGGGAGTIVKITGNNFTNASAVLFNGTPATTFVVTNNTTIGTVAPVGVTSGTISITTPAGTTNSSAIFYGPPSISSFTPMQGAPGTNVMVTGINFTNATAVQFNGLAAASFVVTNNTVLSAVVPANATTGPITVAGPGGTNQSAGNFTISTTTLGIMISSVPNPVFITSNLVYTITVIDYGPQSPMDVMLTNQLPQSVKLIAATTSQGTLATNSNPITGSLGAINNGSSATITLTVTPTVVGSITNTVSVGSELEDSNPGNNSEQAITTVWPLPFLSITNLMSNNLFQVTWPAPLSSFTLQYTTNLATNDVWTKDTAVKVVSGTNVSVIDTNIGLPRFFRLTN